jgi:hypothetical protein
MNQDRQSLTELRVSCAVGGERGKPPRADHVLCLKQLRNVKLGTKLGDDETSRRLASGRHCTTLHCTALSHRKQLRGKNVKFDMIWYDIYLLQMGFHPVAAVGRLVRK